MKLFSAHQSRCSTISPCALMTGVAGDWRTEKRGALPHGVASAVIYRGAPCRSIVLVRPSSLVPRHTCT